jgi:hypothetical protein
MSFLLVGACGRHPDLELDLTKLNCIESNDLNTNGLTANGLTANGLTANGLTANGLTANGLTANGTSASTLDPTQLRLNDLGSISFASLTQSGSPIEFATINGSTIEGKQSELLLTGTDLIGARMNATLLDGTPIPMRIEDIQVRNGITFYSIALLTDRGPIAMCGTAGDAPIPALAVTGYWDKSATYVHDSTRFTFGCVNAAIGKCARWGYQPWTAGQECRNNSCKTRALSEWHRACVRLVRADYCGDGIAHTRSGTLINVYDQLNIQQTSSPGWELEAEWSQDGGSCIGHTRWVRANTSWTETDLEYVQRLCPDRLASTKPEKCDLSNSTYNTQFGFNKSDSERPLLRNESPQYQ